MTIFRSSSLQANADAKDWLDLGVSRTLGVCGRLEAMQES